MPPVFERPDIGINPQPAVAPWFNPFAETDYTEVILKRLADCPAFRKLGRAGMGVYADAYGMARTLATFEPLLELDTVSVRFNRPGVLASLRSVLGYVTTDKVGFRVSMTYLEPLVRVAISALEEGKNEESSGATAVLCAAASRIPPTLFSYAASHKYSCLACLMALGEYEIEHGQTANQTEPTPDGEESEGAVDSTDDKVLRLLDPAPTSAGPVVPHCATSRLKIKPEGKEAKVIRNYAALRAPMLDEKVTCRTGTIENQMSALSRASKVQKNCVNGEAFARFTKTYEAVTQHVLQQAATPQGIACFMETEYAAKYSPEQVRQAKERQFDRDLMGPNLCWKGFVKVQETLSEIKPTRMIMCLEPLVAMHEQILSRSVELAVKLAFPRQNIKGKNMAQKKLLMSKLFERNHRLLSTDFSSFDSTIGPMFQKLESAFLKEFQTVMTHMVLIHFPSIADKLKDKFVLNMEGLTATLENCRKSGEAWTSILNLLLNIALVIDHLDVSVHEFLHSKDVWMVGEGDDRIVAYNGEKFVDFADSVVAHHAKLGFQLEVVIDDPNIAEFCSDIYAREKVGSEWKMSMTKRMKRGLDRLPMQFNMPARFVAARDEGDVKKEDTTSALLLMAVSLHTTLTMTSVRYTPYLFQLYRAAFMQVAAALEDVGGVDNEVGYAMYEEARQRSSLPYLWDGVPRRMDAIYNEVSGLSAPRDMGIYALKMAMQDLGFTHANRTVFNVFCGSVPDCVMDIHYQDPSTFYTHLHAVDVVFEKDEEVNEGRYLPPLGASGGFMLRTSTSEFLKGGGGNDMITENAVIIRYFPGRVGDHVCGSYRKAREALREVCAKLPTHLAAHLEVCLNRPQNPHVAEFGSFKGEEGIQLARDYDEVMRKAVVHSTMIVGACGRAVALFLTDGTLRTMQSHITLVFCGDQGTSKKKEDPAKTAAYCRLVQFYAAKLRAVFEPVPPLEDGPMPNYYTIGNPRSETKEPEVTPEVWAALSTVTGLSRKQLGEPQPKQRASGGAAPKGKAQAGSTGNKPKKPAERSGGRGKPPGKAARQ
jgi:hypothetical protein